MLNLHSALFSHLVVCDSIGTSSDDSSFCIVYCRSVLSGSAKSVCGSGAGSGWGGVRSEAETERFLGTTFLSNKSNNNNNNNNNKKRV